ncbi:sulfite exporter TauE/SafE family protein [Sphingomonas sp.]|uniref:sulfite exporter TauE/SafE family protein n=1 Tax=Sphingomonas sp. TaxID=28214 RepID=UPI001B0158A7|nr:sulfite exporter TauE/SafE family protein [Sphingomonas sp.]MBO9711370.1 sulfite exporter TauE/SafE family protein [Sphingomonas sp.]
MTRSTPLNVSTAQVIAVGVICSWLLIGYAALLVYSVAVNGRLDASLWQFDLVTLLPFAAAGFLAQLIDGSLGMGFGVISNAVMLLLGQPPAVATSSVHTAEGFASGASAASHIWYRNVDWRLFAKLVLPGILGGAIGVTIITVADAAFTRPIVLAYLGLIGVALIWRGRRRARSEAAPRLVQPLGFIGGLLDAAGGGAWGPIVTGNLLIQGTNPAKVVGTVDVSEFFVTVAVSLMFIATMGALAFTTATLGLLLGGVAAAPLGALLARRVPSRLLSGAAGTLLLGIAIVALTRGLPVS